jgi:hypothetical protein
MEEEAMDQEIDRNKNKKQQQQRHGFGGAIGGASGLRHLAGRKRAACGVSHRRPAAHRAAGAQRPVASRVAKSFRVVFS